MRIALCILSLLSIQEQVLAVTVICPRIDDAEAQLQSTFDVSDIVAVVEIARSDGRRGNYRLIPPVIKGHLPEEGPFVIEGCAHSQFEGDVVLTFGKAEDAGLFSVQSTSRIYSEQWDMLWSDTTIEWLRHRVINTSDADDARDIR